MERSRQISKRADAFTLFVGYACLVLLMLALGIGPFVAAVAWRDFGPYEFAPTAQHTVSQKG